MFFTKKTFSLILIICLITAIFCSVFVYASNQLSKSNSLINKHGKALEYLKVIKERVKSNKNYEEDYGGAYIDNDGILNVNFVKGSESIVKVKKEFKSNVIKFHNVKYSLKYLEHIMVTLNDKLIELEISSMELNEQDNRVIIYLDTLDDIKINKIKKVIDSNAIEFKKQELQLQFTTSDSKRQ